MRAAAGSGIFSDSRVICENEVAGVERSFFEIRRVHRKNLPARHLFTQDLDGAHVGKIWTQARVMRDRGGKPYSVVGGLTGFVAKDEDNFLININRQAAEHRSSPGRQGSD